MSKVAKIIIGGIALGALTVFSFGTASLGAFGTFAETISTLTGLGAVAGGAVAGGLASASLALLKPKIPTLSDEFGREVQLNGDPVAPRKIIYGEAWTAGTLRYRNTTGEDNKTLYMLMIIAGHSPDEVV